MSFDLCSQISTSTSRKPCSFEIFFLIVYLGTDAVKIYDLEIFLLYLEILYKAKKKAFMNLRIHGSSCYSCMRVNLII